MPQSGVIQEQGFLFEGTGMGFMENASEKDQKKKKETDDEE